MTNQVIDGVIDLISETRDQIDALDDKPRKTRADLSERLRLVRQLQTLDKQFRSFGKHGQERKAYRDDRYHALITLYLNVDPDAVQWARRFLERHDPETLRQHDAKPKGDERERLGAILFMYDDKPADVRNAAISRFLDQVSDTDGNPPAWFAGPEK